MSSRRTTLPTLRALIDFDGVLPHGLLKSFQKLSDTADITADGMARIREQLKIMGNTPHLAPIAAEMSDFLNETMQAQREIAALGGVNTMEGLARASGAAAQHERGLMKVLKIYAEQREVIKDANFEQARLVKKIAEQTTELKRQQRLVGSREKTRASGEETRRARQLTIQEQAVSAAKRGQREAAQEILLKQDEIVRSAEMQLEADRKLTREAEEYIKSQKRIARNQARHSRSESETAAINARLVESKKILARRKEIEIAGERELVRIGNRRVEAEEKVKRANFEAAAERRRVRRLDIALLRQERTGAKLLEASANNLTEEIEEQHREYRRLTTASRALARTDKERRQINAQVRKTLTRQKEEMRKNEVEASRVGREIRSWNNLGGQFVEHMINTANRIPRLRKQLIGITVALGGIAAGGFLVARAFQGAAERAQLIQRAVLRGGLINREFTQQLSRAIAMRGSTIEDATEFVAQTPSGFRADVGDPVERANIQREISRLGITADEFDIGEIANLPDAQLFEEIFKLADTIYRRTGNPAGVATLGKLLGIDEQEARTLTHLVQSRGGIEKLLEDIHSYRAVSEETVLNNLTLFTSFRDLTGQAGHLSDVFVSALAPTITTMVKALSQAVINTRVFLEENKKLVAFIIGFTIGAFLAVTAAIVKMIAVAVIQIFQLKQRITLQVILTAVTGNWIKVVAVLAIATASGIAAMALLNDVTFESTKAVSANTNALEDNLAARKALIDDQFNLLRLFERQASFQTRIPATARYDPFSSNSENFATEDYARRSPRSAPARGFWGRFFDALTDLYAAPSSLELARQREAEARRRARGIAPQGTSINNTFNIQNSDNQQTAAEIANTMAQQQFALGGDNNASR